MGTRRFGTWILSALLAVPSTAAANAWSVIGFDGQSIGRGGALTGGAWGPAAMHYNPAGMIKRRGQQYSLTYIHGQSLLAFTPADNPELLDFAGFAPQDDADIEAACDTLDENNLCVQDFRRYNSYLERAAGLGIEGEGVVGAYRELNAQQARAAERPKNVDGLTLGFTTSIDDVEKLLPTAIGVSVFLPSDPWPYLVYQHLKGPTSPYFFQYDDLPHRILINLGGAVEPVRNLRLGLSVDIAAHANARVDATALLPAELRLGSLLSPDPNVVDVAIVPDGTVQAPLTFRPIVGVQYSVDDVLDLGASYREPQQIDVKATANLILTSPYATEEVPIELNTGLRFQPREVAAGAAWTPLDGLALFADVSWQQWSKFQPEFAVDGSISGAGLSAAACEVFKTFADLSQVLDLAEDVVGISSDDVCGLIDDQIDEEIEFTVWDRDEWGLNDTFNPAFGASYGPSWWTIAGGYRYRPNPLPEQDGLFNLLGADTHVIGGSLEVRFLSWLSGGLFAQAQMLRQTTVRKDPATVDDGTGGADAFPDLDSDPQSGPSGAFNRRHPTLDELSDYVDGAQRLNPGYPSYTVGGTYLSGGLQLMAEF